MPAPPFTIRTAELRDLSRISAICRASMPDDPSFDFIWKYHHQYPEDHDFFWVQWAKESLFDPQKTFLVAEEPASVDSKHEGRGDAVATIFAFAIWQRNEHPYTIMQNLTSLINHDFLTTLHRYITKIENWAISKQYVRRDADLDRLANHRKTMAAINTKYWTTMYPRNYHLVLLATHPDYRRRGAGSALTRWGIEKGLEEGMDVGVEASPMGFPMYKHLGFELLEEVVVEPLKDDDTQSPIKVMMYVKDK